MNYKKRFFPRILLCILIIHFFIGCHIPDEKKVQDQGINKTYQYLEYEEASEPVPVDPSAWASVPDVLQGSYGSTDIRYAKSVPPGIQETSTLWSTYAWRGERVSAQIVLWSAVGKGNIRFEWSALKSEKGIEFPLSSLKARFVRYVLTDEFAGGCTPHKIDGLEVSLAADPLDEVNELPYKGMTTRPVWVSIDVPIDLLPGVYSGSLTVLSDSGENLEFNIELEVGTAVLPDPSVWSYHLDLWQNPAAVARFHDVEPWSEAHYAYLEPLIKLLANAGQKVITTSIIDRPWNGQVEDPYLSMIEWRKQKDGTWLYDYAVFDQYVAFVEDCGINSQINCYSMIPWGNRFIYYNAETESVDTLIASPGSEAYEEHWEPFLLDFSNHLKQKGWFKKTAIAMDERPVEDMRKTIELVNRVVPGLNITLAGGYHPEIEKDLIDMCVASKHHIPEEVINRRRKEGKHTTYYTCCVEVYPNNFTYSPPAESTWQAWHAASRGYSGYLRWAYNSWVKEPLIDSRFRNWPAGDTYLVYPEARSSIRFERLREGIQDYEKIRILRDKLKAMNSYEAKSKSLQLDTHLQRYEILALDSVPAGEMLEEGKQILYQISNAYF